MWFFNKPKWKYINPDKRCTYPPYIDNIDYCWGYALAYDKGCLEEFIKTSCPACDLWKDNLNLFKNLTVKESVPIMNKIQEVLKKKYGKEKKKGIK